MHLTSRGGKTKEAASMLTPQGVGVEKIAERASA